MQSWMRGADAWVVAIRADVAKGPALLQQLADNGLEMVPVLPAFTVEDQVSVCGRNRLKRLFSARLLKKPTVLTR